MTYNLDGLVAVVWIKAGDGEELTLQLDPVKDAIPYDRPLLARLLREMADRLDEISTTVVEGS